MSKHILDLIELIEKLTGPSKEVDRILAVAIGGWHRVLPRHAKNKHGAWISPDDWIGEMSDGSPIFDQLHGTTMYREVPNVTESLDAALSIVGRHYPDWDWIIGRTNGGLTTHCRLGNNLEYFGETAPLAVLSALLHSISEQNRRHR